MMDVVNRNGDEINISKLSEALGCEVVEISALKGMGIKEAAEKAVALASSNAKNNVVHNFSPEVEKTLTYISDNLGTEVPADLKRFYSIKIFERDEKISEAFNITKDFEEIIKATEDKMDDDSESIITNERYIYISNIIKDCYTRKNKAKDTTSDKIDKIVTNRWLSLPIFAVIMWLVYFISITTVGTIATDWANDGVFGDGWHLFSIGASDYEEALDEYNFDQIKIDAFIEKVQEEGINTAAINEALTNKELEKTSDIENFLVESNHIKAEAKIENEDGVTGETLVTSTDFAKALENEEPSPANYGIWVEGVPVLIEGLLEHLGTAQWLNSLILDGIIGGVGAVLGFVPQMLVLFLLLAFLEACGYMARIAFIMDRIFRKFGLSGKSFIPILIGTGCGIPGIMASRTIENDRDRKMTIIVTTFIPCGAKLPIIALISGALFGGASWVAPSTYFVGIAAIIISGIILKKTKMFSGDPAPFVMELPNYHMPTLGNLLRSMWERGWSFIKKAGTVILLSTIFVWFTSNFGIVDGKLGMVENLSNGFLASIGHAIAWIFTPLGFGNWQSTVATITGLIAKENVVGTFGVLHGFAEVAEDGSEIWGTLSASFTTVSACSFLVFNLLCAPCFAAIGAIRREMNNAKWTWFAIGYQTGFAYAVSLCIYQFGNLLIGGEFGIGTVAAFLILACFIYLLVKPQKGSNKLSFSA